MKLTAQQWLEQFALAWESEECLLFPFGITRDGYGRVKIDGQKYLAHRFICEMTHGPAPTVEHHAAHRCGVRRCVNKRHVRWATPAENCVDRDTHGTTARGERMGSSKLTEVQVIAIRAARGSQREIAAQYGISHRMVGDIRRRKYWAWL